MSGWQLAGDAPAAYSRFNVKIMEPWTDDLIRSANCRDGDRVLDVACGTGVVSNRISLVTTKHCSITGIDVNEGMLNVARRNPQMTWHLGSATELPFEADSFEVVICQQGLQYFPDRPTAMREMARVLVPNGRLAVNVWGALDRQPGLLAIVETVGEFLGQDSQAALAMGTRSTRAKNSTGSLGIRSCGMSMCASSIAPCGILTRQIMWPGSWARHPSPRNSWHNQRTGNAPSSHGRPSSFRLIWTMPDWLFLGKTISSQLSSDYHSDLVGRHPAPLHLSPRPMRQCKATCSIQRAV